MLVVDREQGSEPRWWRAGAGEHVDRGVGEELLDDLCRAPEDTVWSLQPVDRGLQHTAAIPLEMSETRGPSSVVHVLGKRWNQQNTGQREDARRSNFEPRAVPPKGARGLMRLMPATAAQLGVRDVFDVRENIDAGVRHLRYLLDLYRGNVPFALAAYNAGVAAVPRYSGIPPYAETQAYVSRILRLLQEAGIPTKMDGAVSTDSATASRTLYCYEAPAGRVVYSNLPIDRLSEAARAMLRGR